MTTFSTTLKWFLALSVLHFLSAEAATFRDDRGVVHTWDNSQKARIGVRAGIGAVSLYHMGMRDEQLVATWGLWGVRGSDYDPENPTQPSIYPEVDPSPEEAAFLTSAINLSPSCWTNPRGCFRWDNITDVLDIQDQIDFIVIIDNGASGILDVEGETGIIAAEEAGMQVIFVDTFYDYNENCRASNFTVFDPSFCYGRSMIDIAMRIEDLAIFLGADVDVATLNTQKQAACDAAQSFTDAMEEVHSKGINVKVSILGTDTDPDTGASIAVVRDFDPIELWVPRTLEELGMPLLHAGEENNAFITGDEYFVDCAPGNVNQTCNENTLFPVDFWLIDSRSFVLIDDNFKLLFPDRAMLADQVYSYPRNDGSISYVMIKSLLDEYRTRLSSAAKVSGTASKDCSAVDPKATTHIVADGTGGLGLNDYICYNEDLIQKEYLKCAQSAPTPAPVTAPTPAQPTPSSPTPNPPTSPTSTNGNNSPSSVASTCLHWGMAWISVVTMFSMFH